MYVYSTTISAEYMFHDTIVEDFAILQIRNILHKYTPLHNYIQLHSASDHFSSHAVAMQCPLTLHNPPLYHLLLPLHPSHDLRCLYTAPGHLWYTSSKLQTKTPIKCGCEDTGILLLSNLKTIMTLFT